MNREGGQIDWLKMAALAMLAACGLAACCGTAGAQVSLEELTRDPTWHPPTEAEVRQQVIDWLDDRKPEPDLRRQVEALWAEASAAGDDDDNTADNNTAHENSGNDAAEKETPGDRSTPAQRLERVVQGFALVDPQASEIAELCSQPHQPGTRLTYDWLTGDETPRFVAANLRLWLARWLAQERMYEEAQAQLNDLTPSDVVDPGALLFYQSVCHHWLLEKEAGLKSIARLLEHQKTIPRRYAQLAELMQADLSGLKEESLDHISRRMNDVTRRLNLGHAGKRVRGVEDEIIASLDKLIENLEQQAQQGGQGNSGNAGGNRVITPAADSQIVPGGGPGEVVKKNIGNKSGWGDLPPKEREQAMQQISKEFPSHYRDIIEQYFRKLASDQEQK